MNAVTSLRSTPTPPPLPHNYEAEQALLGGLLANNQVFDLVADAVRAEDFFDPVHGRIFDAICLSIRRGQTASYLTLRNSFEIDPGLQDAGGAKYLARLENATVSIYACDDYARNIRDLADRRRLILACERAIEDARAVALDQTAASVSASLISELETGMIGPDDGLVTIADVAERIVNHLNDDFPCYQTGLPTLDHALGGGLFEHKLYGLAADDKAGKSMLMATIAHNLNMAGVRTLYLSLEMGPDEQVQRIMARMMGLNSLSFLDRSSRFSKGLQEAAGQAAVDLRNHNNLLLVQRPRMTREDVKTTIAKAVLGRKVRGVFLDYVQLVSGQRSGESLATHYDNVTQDLAEATVRLPCFIVAAAQTNREGNVRQGDGLLKACDMALRLHKIEVVNAADEAWLEMWRTRFTPKRHVGSEKEPALRIMTKAGPYFAEIE